MIDLDWNTRFPNLAELAPKDRALFQSRARPVRFAKGSVLFGPDKSPDTLLMLVEGTVRVQQTNAEGREIVLYRVQGGESCVMTSATLLAYGDLAAEGVAETEVQAIALPRATFEELLATSPTFRTFVLNAYASRMGDLFQVIEDIAFRKIDIRLAQRLLRLADSSDTLHATHAQIAAELGTAREVVSRQLTDFQKRGWIETARGAVHITNRAALDALSSAV